MVTFVIQCKFYIIACRTTDHNQACTDHEHYVLNPIYSTFCNGSDENLARDSRESETPQHQTTTDKTSGYEFIDTLPTHPRVVKNEHMYSDIDALVPCTLKDNDTLSSVQLLVTDVDANDP